MKTSIMNWENELTTALKIKYPIVQAPMLGVTTPEMVAAVCEQGGLGSLPVGGLSPEKTIELIRKTKALTSRPFAVNLFANQLPKNPDLQAAHDMQDLLHKICSENNFDCEFPDPARFKFYSYTDQIHCLLEERIPVVSFTFGSMDASSINRLKQNGALLIGTATCLEEAEILDEAGIDMITAQGIEAGGHRGTFLEDRPLPMVGLVSLISGVARRIKKPVIAAGGIGDGKSVKAAFILGAKGVQVGTAFIASSESAAIPAYKEALKNARDTDTVLTKSFSGRWARGLKNRFIAEVDNSGIKIPEYPVQGSLTMSLRLAAQQQDNKDFTTLWSGQSPSMAESLPVADIFNRLIKQAEETR